MALLPDFGTWLLRSVRRETGYFSDSPVSVIERLNALPRPLRTADKDTLVGAVLTLGPSLQVALHMLLELLPLDESRERLGEVLVPTLGQLQRSLESTLSSFEGCGVADLDIDIAPDADDTPLPTPQAATYGSVVRSVSTSTSEDFVISKPEPSPLDTPMQIRTEQHSQRKRQPSIQFVPTHDEIPRTLTASPERVATPKEKFPTLDETDTRPPSPVAKPQQRWPDPAADLALVKEFRAEMRVNAAIQVAVDSLEFAEGQLKIVKEVNRLYGGSFDLLHRHFYEGYNRILFRALELERREFDSPPYAASIADAASEANSSAPGPQRSVSFENPIVLPPLPPLESRPATPAKAASPVKPALVRRNTLQGHDARPARPRVELKRRLSLAEELALVGEDETESEGEEWGGEEGESGRSNRESESESEESEDSSDEDEGGGVGGPDGAPGGGQSSDDTSEEEDDDDDDDDDDDGDDDDEGESDEDDLFAAIQLINAAAGATAHERRGGARARTKRLETGVDVISPPTSPERTIEARSETA